jgi:hypothetical protein
MKVGDLILRLMNLPPDAEVFVEISFDDTGEVEGDRCVRNAVDVGHFLGDEATVSICGANYPDCDFSAAK